jgi:ornithine--oxo-acid transaminase
MDTTRTNIAELHSQHGSGKFELHKKHLNTQMVNVLRTIGYDRVYVRAEGPYLFDEKDQRYLDLLSGYGVFALGRNHPTVVRRLKEALDARLPDLVQMDVSVLAGLLGEKILATTPGDLDKIFFCNSGTEAVEAAIKFSRSATGRSRILYCDHAFHGLTMGSLSLNGDPNFRTGFEPFLPGCDRIPYDDPSALERELSRGDVAAFIVEPIQGKGVNIPGDSFLPEASRLCRKHGTLLVADEIQTGLGRTGKLWAVEHWGVEPDMILMAKALSGGFVPVGAVALRKGVFDRVFNRMDRAVIHGSTFGKNNLAMTAGLATLEVMEEERLVENAARIGGDLLRELQALVPRYEYLKEVRGVGLMLGIEFGPPKSMSLKAAWTLLEKAEKGLFCQLITIPLFSEHRILTQVAGHGSHVVKLLPSLVLSDTDREWIVTAMDTTIAASHKVPGAVFDLGKKLATQAIKARTARG